MHILVINSGSSSIKLSLFDSGSADGSEPSCVYDGELSGVGTTDATLELQSGAGTDLSAPQAKSKAETLKEAIGLVFETVTKAGMPAFDAIGYRVVHPGAELTDHARITPAVLADLEAAAAFAPLHDPEAVAVIREGLGYFPNLPQFACFDTVFHRTIPEEASTYPLPQAIRDSGVRRYGFHGLSCESIVQQMRARPEPFPRRLVIAHLGSGCSVTALVDGRSVDTTMGLTPTGGIVMGTRPGDLDPGVVLYLLRQQAGSRDAAISAVETILNHSSGVVALSQLPNNMKEVREAAEAENAAALLALRVFTRSVTKAIGSFCWLLGGLDAIVFAGGIGEHDHDARTEILAGLHDLGVTLDVSANKSNSPGLRLISAQGSRTALFVVPAQEDRMIAVHVIGMSRS